MHPVNTKLCAKHGKTHTLVHACCIKLRIAADGSSHCHIIQILPFLTKRPAGLHIIKINIDLLCLIQNIFLMIKILNIYMSAEEIIYKSFFQQSFIRYRCHIISGIRIRIGDSICISLCDPAFCVAVFHILQDFAYHSFGHGFSPDHLIFIVIPDNTAVFHDSPFHTPEHRKLLRDQLSGPSGCRHHIMSVIDQTLQNISVPFRNLILAVQKSSVHIHCNDIFFHNFLLFVFSHRQKAYLHCTRISFGSTDTHKYSYLLSVKRRLFFHFTTTYTTAQELPDPHHKRLVRS